MGAEDGLILTHPAGGAQGATLTTSPQAPYDRSVRAPGFLRFPAPFSLCVPLAFAAAAGAGPRFTDITEASRLDFRHRTGFDGSHWFPEIVTGGVGIADLDGIAVDPSDYQRHASSFQAPPQDLALAFPDVTIYEAGACSACLSTTMLFLQRFADSIREYRLEDGKLHVVLGRDVADVPAGTIVIGNCAARHQEKGPFAKGCPPVASQIHKAITGQEPEGPVE